MFSCEELVDRLCDFIHDHYPSHFVPSLHKVDIVMDFEEEPYPINDEEIPKRYKEKFGVTLKCIIHRCFFTTEYFNLLFADTAEQISVAQKKFPYHFQFKSQDDFMLIYNRSKHLKALPLTQSDLLQL